MLNPRATHVDTLIGQINGFLNSLAGCDLQRTLVAAAPLRDITSIPYHIRSGTVTPVAGLQLEAYLKPILTTLYSEAGEKELAALNTGAVSRQLRNLPSCLKLNETQERLLQETVLCIESGAYRAGAVMAWNLAYDFMRQWVFDNRLQIFNEALKKNHVDRNGSPCFDAIGDYEDFFKRKSGERTVIDTWFFVDIIGEKLRDSLRHYLQRRNDYAHPSFKTPSAEQTNAYVKDLVEIVTGSPFTQTVAKARLNSIGVASSAR